MNTIVFDSELKFRKYLIKNSSNIIYVILLEDKLDNTITIDFLDINEKENLEIYNKTFDIVCTNNTSFNRIMEFLKI